jgi:nickel-dependent lactate racemase
MRIDIACGSRHLDVDVPTENLIAVHRQPQAERLTDPADAVRAALEQPNNYPPLRRALTPDDHIAVVVDESITALPELLPPILDHLQSAHIEPEAVTLVCPASSSQQPWIDELPDAFQDVHVEVHQPGDRKKLAYLATTKQGRRIYLNRTAVDADQLVVLTRRSYDCLLGYSGAEGAIFPGLADEATLDDVHGRLSLEAPGGQPRPLKREAGEVAWHLGMPFLVQVIEGAAGEVLHVVGGSLDSSAAGERLLDARWRVEVDEPADVVLATLSAEPPNPLTFEDLSRAFLAASRVVRPGGKIVLLSDADPDLGASAAVMRGYDEPRDALQRLLKEKPADLEAGFGWASAAEQAHLYLLSRLDPEVAEELFTTPLEHVGQVQKLLGRRCLVLPDAHRTIAVLKPVNSQ